MRPPRSLFAAALLATAPAVAPSPARAAPAPSPARAAPALPDEAELQRRAARFAAVDLTVDLTALPASERAALGKLVEAARLLDTLFLRQVWAGNEALLGELAADPTPLGRARLDAFLLDKGPWSRVDGNAPLLPGVPPKPPAANFYPAGATKADVDAWLKTLAPDARAAADGFYTTIRRTPDGRFQSVPYAVEYQGELALAAALLRDAARATREPSLRAFLDARAAALLSNDYYASDVAWMQLDSTVEPTFGPYETYEDEWYSAKAAFEAFVTVRDAAETKKLARFSSELQDIEDHLPIDPKLRNPKLGALAPIRVVNELFASGDAARGVATAAYNLPNDERITRERGSKRVMLRNVQQAKFDKVLLPIARVALSPADQKRVSFDAFFTHILMHELVHGLGPHTVTGSARTVRAALEDASSAVEEAKADIGGMFALGRLIDRGVVDRRLEETLYVTYLASGFRSIRFGVSEAHGRGVALQMNWMLDAGAFRVAPDGTFSVDAAKAKQAVASLTHELMTLQAAGDRDRARALLARMGVVRPEVKRVLDRLTDVPIDIAPHFTTAETLAPRR